MSEHTYSAEFASGFRAELTVSPTLFRVAWSPTLPTGMHGPRLRRFLATYRAWRDECIADFSKRTGITAAVLDL
jgi:hypothetical protein